MVRRLSRRQELVVDNHISIGDTVTARRATGLELGWQMRPSRTSIVVAVGRRLVPYVIEATIVPTAIFYALLTVADIRWAMLGALTWTYAAVGRRVIAGRPVPGLLILATLGISLRTVVALASSNDIVYFLQPILRTFVTGAVFAGSVLIGRPLIARFAGDFCPLADDVRCRPGVLGLFRRLSIVWAAVNLLAAGSHLLLLATVPVPVFVVAAAATAWLVTASGVLVTVVDSVTTARREGLITALSPNGTLYAATVHPLAR